MNMIKEMIIEADMRTKSLEKMEEMWMNLEY